jgi:hypothetical protein
MYSTGVIGLIKWGTNCHAIVCGGDNGVQSNCLHTDVIHSLKEAGISIDRVSPSDECGIDGNGNWLESNKVDMSGD